MQVICSDTNIWIDFQSLNRIDWPFLLDYTYIMSKPALDDEVLSPIGQASRLLEMGLVAVDPSDDELELYMTLASKYRKLSVYDALALTIAKSRSIILLTGDKALRNAAEAEHVVVRGLLWITDQLCNEQQITREEHRSCMQEILDGIRVTYRYPKHEIENRLNR